MENRRAPHGQAGCGRTSGEETHKGTEVVVKTHKHTQVNYYPYKSSTAAHSHNYNCLLHDLRMSLEMETPRERGGENTAFMGTFLARGITTLLELSGLLFHRNDTQPGKYGAPKALFFWRLVQTIMRD